MRKLFALLFLMQSWTLAQNRFDGTWQMKMDTLEFSGPPEDYLFVDGMYHCKSCSCAGNVRAHHAVASAAPAA
jgi:hypothetical protein